MFDKTTKSLSVLLFSAQNLKIFCFHENTECGYWKMIIVRTGKYSFIENNFGKKLWKFQKEYKIAFCRSPVLMNSELKRLQICE